MSWFLPQLLGLRYRQYRDEVMAWCGDSFVVNLLGSFQVEVPL